MKSIVVTILIVFSTINMQAQFRKSFRSAIRDAVKKDVGIYQASGFEEEEETVLKYAKKNGIKIFNMQTGDATSKFGDVYIPIISLTFGYEKELADIQKEKELNKDKNAEFNRNLGVAIVGTATLAYKTAGYVMKKAIDIKFVTEEALTHPTPSRTSSGSENIEDNKAKDNSNENKTVGDISSSDYRDGNFKCLTYEEVDGWGDCTNSYYQACDYKFSDGIKGTLFFSKECKKYCLGCSLGITGMGLNTCTYYNDKEMAIKALYCYLKTGKPMRGNVGCGE